MCTERSAPALIRVYTVVRVMLSNGTAAPTRRATVPRIHLPVRAKRGSSRRSPVPPLTPASSRGPRVDSPRARNLLVRREVSPGVTGAPAEESMAQRWRPRRGPPVVDPREPVQAGSLGGRPGRARGADRNREARPGRDDHDHEGAAVPLNPTQVHDQAFRIVFRGYDVAAVDDFLDQVQAELTRLMEAQVAKADTADRGSPDSTASEPVATPRSRDDDGAAARALRTLDRAEQ